MFKNLNLELIKEIKFKKIDELEMYVNSYEDSYKIIFSKIINFNYSLDELKKFDELDGGLDIIEIIHEYDQPNKNNLKCYGYQVSSSGLLHKYHYVNIYGDAEITILSQEIYIESLSK